MSKTKVLFILKKIRRVIQEMVGDGNREKFLKN
jgi:hypothetical protein